MCREIGMVAESLSGGMVGSLPDFSDIKIDSVTGCRQTKKARSGGERKDRCRCLQRAVAPDGVMKRQSARSAASIW